jgi:hypothetical protein
MNQPDGKKRAPYLIVGLLCALGVLFLSLSWQLATLTAMVQTPASGMPGVAPTTLSSGTFENVADVAAGTTDTFASSLTPSSARPREARYRVTGGQGAPATGDGADKLPNLNLSWVPPARTDPCERPVTNPIPCENSKPGNPPSEWYVIGDGDPSIQGFGTAMSVNRGDVVDFKIDTVATHYRLDIYRMGFYGGMGARKVATVLPTAPLPQKQPACVSDASSGLVDCGNWAVSASWAIPSDATSGIHFAKVERQDTGGASHIVFIVRDDVGTSDLLFQTPDTTWQAYNQYGGNSLYGMPPCWEPCRAFKVSYNRPFNTAAVVPQTWLFSTEYPMVRWLEANGYNVSSGLSTLVEL